MPDMQYFQNMLFKAGLVPDILILGGWLYAVVLLIVLLYHFFSYILKLLTEERK